MTMQRIRAGREGRLVRTTIISLFFCGLTGAGLKAASLGGRVLDPDGGAVPRAVVQLLGRDGDRRSTRADAEGRYRFGEVPPGRYSLVADSDDTALSGGFEIHLDGEDRQVDIVLKLAPTQTQVQVIGSLTPLTAQETAKAVHVIDADALRRRNEFSLGEALRETPGLRVRQLGGPGAQTTIISRGLRGHDTAFLIDGLRFRDASTIQGDATSFYQDVQLVDVDRIEVLRGSGSSLYGSHAMGAVVNLVSNEGGGDAHGEALVERGGLGLWRGTARVGGGFDDDRWVYSGGVGHLNVTDGVDGFDVNRNTTAQGFLKRSFGRGVSLSGRVIGADAFTTLNESPTFPAEVLANAPASGPIRAVGPSSRQVRNFAAGLPFAAGSATFVPAFNDPDNHRSSEYLATAVILRHDFSPSGSYRVSWHGVDTDRVFRDGPAGQGAFDPLFGDESVFDGRVDTLQARLDLGSGRLHLFTFGYEYERETFLNRTASENPDPSRRGLGLSDVEQSSNALFAQQQLRLLDGRLQLSASGRVQSFDLGATFFSGDDNPFASTDVQSPKTAYTADGSIAYFMRSSQTKLRAHVGNAYRAPASFERFGGTFSSFSSGFDFWGDPRLRPERSVAVDAGVDQWFFNSRLQLNGTVFYTALQETIVFDFGVIDPATDPFGRFGGYRNTGGGLARGAEAGARLTLDSKTSINGSYTYTNSDSRTPTVGDAFFKTLGLSDHMFTLTTTRWLTRRANLTFDFFGASDYSANLFGAPSRMVFNGPKKADVSFSYGLPIGEGREARLYFKAENVFDQRYFENGFAAPGIWGVGGVRFLF